MILNPKPVDLDEITRCLASSNKVEVSLGFLMLAVYEASLRREAGIDFKWLEVPKGDWEISIPREYISSGYYTEKKRSEYFNNL